MRREQRPLTRAPEVRSDGEAKRIVGYAAVFYRAEDPGTQFQLWPNMYERIMPGAFDRAITNDDVRALFNHDPNQVLGRNKSGTLSLSVDDIGLRYDIEPGDSPLHRSVMEMLERGDISGSSFAFRVQDTDQTFRQEGQNEIREIRAVELFDVGPVTYPAYEASTSGTRSDHFAEARSAYDLWRNERKRASVLRETLLRQVALHDLLRGPY